MLAKRPSCPSDALVRLLCELSRSAGSVSAPALRAPALTGSEFGLPILDVPRRAPRRPQRAASVGSAAAAAAVKTARKDAEAVRVQRVVLLRAQARSSHLRHELGGQTSNRCALLSHFERKISAAKNTIL